MEKNGMRIWGYSERGIINSLLFKMEKEGFKKLFSLTKNRKINIEPDDMEVFLEHSLSGYGDTDVIVMDKTNIIFIEAKVNARNRWYIEKEYKESKKRECKKNQCF